MIRGRLLLIVAPLVAVLACSSGDDSSTSSGNQGAACKVDADCPAKLAQCVTQGSSSACTGALDDHPFDRECAGATQAAAAACPGLVCVSLKPNKQNKAGLCSTFCVGDADCPEGKCVFAAGYSLCFRKCATSDDCANGFVCGADGVCSVTLL